MSETYSIACKDCRKHIWIAQSSYSEPKEGCIYSSKLYLKKHFEFLIDHMGHNLIFGKNAHEPIRDYEEIEVEGEDMPIKLKYDALCSIGMQQKESTQNEYKDESQNKRVTQVKNSKYCGCGCGLLPKDHKQSLGAFMGRTKY